MRWSVLVLSQCFKKEDYDGMEESSDWRWRGGDLSLPPLQRGLIISARTPQRTLKGHFASALAQTPEEKKIKARLTRLGRAIIMKVFLGQMCR